MMSRMKVGKFFAVNLGCFLVLLLGVELCFGNWLSPQKLSNLLIIRGVTLRFDVGEIYPTKNPVAYYKRDLNGFRGEYDSPGTIDILTMGASNVDQRYLTEGLTFQDRIVQKFKETGKRVSVVNAAADGQTTYGHIKSFDVWFPFVRGLKPKYYLYYIGPADVFVPVGYGLDKKTSNRSDDFENSYTDSWKNHLKDRSAIYRLFVVARGLVWAHNSKAFHGSEKPSNIKFLKVPSPPPPLTEEQKQKILDYETRLNLLFRKTLDFNPDSKIVCVAPGFIGFWKKDKNGVLWTESVENHFLLKAMNATLLKVCEKFQGHGIDLANELPFENEDFYDSSHFSPEGAKKTGDYLFTKLRGFFD